MDDWQADFTNNPYNDYEIIVEILKNNELIAVIEEINNEWVINLYPNNSNAHIPFKWLLGLMQEIKIRFGDM